MRTLHNRHYAQLRFKLLFQGVASESRNNVILSLPIITWCCLNALLLARMMHVSLDCCYITAAPETIG